MFEVVAIVNILGRRELPPKELRSGKRYSKNSL
jgi:hypothetical protein